MNPDYFNINWKHFVLIGIGHDSSDRPLTDFLESCAGAVRGGLLFYGKNDYAGEVLILKCDEEWNCYQRVNNTDDDDKDWKLIGYLEDMNYPR